MAIAKIQVRGVIPAIVLGNDASGAVSEEMLSRQIEYFLAAGVHGMYMNGTTGEGAVLSTEEKAEVVRIAMKVVGGKIPLYGVCLQPSTDAVIHEAKVMADLGVACIAAVPPYYYASSQDVIKKHYLKIAEESELPVMLYNIPQNTHAPVTAETIIELSRHPNIVGIKDSSGDFRNYNRILLATDSSEFACVQGEDGLDAAAFLIGSPGVVTGLGNVSIEHYLAMYRAAEAGNRAEVLEHQKTIFRIAEIIPAAGGAVLPAIKAAVELLGRGNRRMKVEAMTLSEEHVASVRRVLEQEGLL